MINFPLFSVNSFTQYSKNQYITKVCLPLTVGGDSNVSQINNKNFRISCQVSLFNTADSLAVDCIVLKTRSHNINCCSTSSVPSNVKLNYENIYLNHNTRYCFLHIILKIACVYLHFHLTQPIHSWPINLDITQNLNIEWFWLYLAIPWQTSLLIYKPGNKEI